jgi:hypothetical protein
MWAIRVSEPNYFRGAHKFAPEDVGTGGALPKAGCVACAPPNAWELDWAEKAAKAFPAPVCPPKAANALLLWPKPEKAPPVEGATGAMPPPSGVPSPKADGCPKPPPVPLPKAEGCPNATNIHSVNLWNVTDRQRSRHYSSGHLAQSHLTQKGLHHQRRRHRRPSPRQKGHRHQSSEGCRRR